MPISQPPNNQLFISHILSISIFICPNLDDRCSELDEKKLKLLIPQINPLRLKSV